MRFAWPMAWEICRGDVGDSFCIDADNLGSEVSKPCNKDELTRMTNTLLRSNSSCDGISGAILLATTLCWRKEVCQRNNFLDGSIFCRRNQPQIFHTHYCRIVPDRGRRKRDKIQIGKGGALVRVQNKGVAKDQPGAA